MEPQRLRELASRKPLCVRVLIFRVRSFSRCFTRTRILHRAYIGMSVTFKAQPKSFRVKYFNFAHFKKGNSKSYIQQYIDISLHFLRNKYFALMCFA